MLTGRLVKIRAMESKDLSLLADLANHPLVRGNVVGWDWPIARDGQQEWLQRARGDASTRRLTVTALESDDAIGLTGLWEIDWRNQSAVTGVKLMPGVAPKGAGSDSIMLTMAWSFYEVGLRRLHSSILEFNKASINAYVRRCGWRVEGTGREAIFRDGGWRDLLYVGILKAEFDALPDAADYVRRIGTLGATPVDAPS